MSNLINIMWNFFFRLILIFLHFSYSGYQYCNLIWTFFKKTPIYLFQSQVLDTRILVSEFVEKLEKCPSHFAVVIGKDGINVEDFSNLVTWCFAARISFVSFYDYTGKLKANKSIYYQYLLDKKKVDPKCLVFDLEKENPRNGMLHRIHLNIVSLGDGKPLLVQVAKNLTNKVVLDELKNVEINERLIKEELFKLTRFPEPDLGLICGSIFSTFGFLPWHIRVTEFLQLKSVKGIQVSEFNFLLKKYSLCTQRFGK